MEDMSQGKQTVSDKDIIALLKQDEDPFLAATEVAEHFGHSRQWAHSRLEALHQDGPVSKKKAGSSSVIWWV